ncbi:MAG: aspartate 1-decarboxylase [Kiritimatiellia bacterium]|jgi:aspartate 1-decarboxylase|nr:aspartate 1-decarboxylase [Kiritimatiellia bacterium]
MQRVMLKAKIHRATLTATELHYEGSIALDRLLLEQADILPGEQVHVLNVNNGERIVTYAIEAPPGSGTVSLRGAAARTGQVGDTLIILTYAVIAEEERGVFKSRTVYVDVQNHCVAPQRLQAIPEGESST